MPAAPPLPALSDLTSSDPRDNPVRREAAFHSAWVDSHLLSERLLAVTELWALARKGVEILSQLVLLSVFWTNPQTALLLASLQFSQVFWKAHQSPFHGSAPELSQPCPSCPFSSQETGLTVPSNSPVTAAPSPHFTALLATGLSTLLLPWLLQSKPGHT